MSPPQAPLEARAVLLALSPHRDHDLFVRALVEGRGLTGFHVPRGRSPRRKDRGSLQPFALGELHTDTRGILRRFEPDPVLASSRLAQRPLRYLTAQLLAELALAWVPEDPDDLLFAPTWQHLARLHAPEEPALGASIARHLGRFLGQAGLLDLRPRCVSCGASLDGGPSARIEPGTRVAALGPEGLLCPACARTGPRPSRAVRGPAWLDAVATGLLWESLPPTPEGAPDPEPDLASLDSLVGATERVLERPLRAWSLLRQGLHRRRAA